MLINFLSCYLKCDIKRVYTLYDLSKINLLVNIEKNGQIEKLLKKIKNRICEIWAAFTLD